MLKLLISIFGIILIITIGLIDFKKIVDDEQSLVVNNGSVGVYIINLDKSVARYENALKYANPVGLTVQRVSGIDGSALSEEELNNKVNFAEYKINMGVLPKRGMIGCTLSHYKAWQEFLDSGNEFALILEDDVQFNPSVMRKTIDDLIDSKQLWDLNMFEISHKGTPLMIKRFNEDSNLAIYLTQVTHGGAYLVNRKTAIRLLQKALPIRFAIDHYFTRAWEFDVKLTGVEPRIAHQAFDESITNKTTKNYQNISEKLTFIECLQGGLSKLRTYINWFVYNLYHYLK